MIVFLFLWISSGLAEEQLSAGIKYSIVASNVVRPSTVYQVVASLASDSLPCRVVASISRGGVAVSSNELQLMASQSQDLLLKVPPGGDKTDSYTLRVEGHRCHPAGSGLAFEHKLPLIFHKQFLSITSVL